MGSQVPFEAVIVWKVDRLARRVIDFLHADETLQARGAAIVCVEQSIDMTTGEGRAFAQMLAVFGEMEAAAISSRIMAAREQLISQGRVAGGRAAVRLARCAQPRRAGLRPCPGPRTDRVGARDGRSGCCEETPSTRSDMAERSRGASASDPPARVARGATPAWTS